MQISFSEKVFEDNSLNDTRGTRKLNWSLLEAMLLQQLGSFLEEQSV